VKVLDEIEEYDAVWVAERVALDVCVAESVATDVGAAVSQMKATGDTDGVAADTSTSEASTLGQRRRAKPPTLESTEGTTRRPDASRADTDVPLMPDTTPENTRMPTHASMPLPTR